MYWLLKIDLMMEQNYKGAKTGRPGQSITSLSFYNLVQPNNNSFIEELKKYNDGDTSLEQAVQKGVVTSRIIINKKKVQFYKNGVVTNRMCHEGGSNSNSNIMFLLQQLQAITELEKVTRIRNWIKQYWGLIGR